LPLVVLPAFAGQLNILLLTLFRAAAEQYDDPIPVFAEVDSVSRTKVDAALKDPADDAFHI
jgi:hypothetical protein